jgi:hypothetical protein
MSQPKKWEMGRILTSPTSFKRKKQKLGKLFWKSVQDAKKNFGKLTSGVVDKLNKGKKDLDITHDAEEARARMQVLLARIRLLFFSCRGSMSGSCWWR